MPYDAEDMNSKTAKLLRRYSRISELSLNQIKRQWNSDSPEKRAQTRTQMVSMLWSTKCREWRGRMGFVAKEAAESLGIPFDTYRGWEKGVIPAKFVRSVISDMMKQKEGQKSA